MPTNTPRSSVHPKFDSATKQDVDDNNDEKAENGQEESAAVGDESLQENTSTHPNRWSKDHPLFSIIPVVVTLAIGILAYIEHTNLAAERNKLDRWISDQRIGLESQTQRSEENLRLKLDQSETERIRMSKRMEHSLGSSNQNLTRVLKEKELDQNRHLKSSDISARMIEAAVDILKTPPNKDNQALREWATDVINANAGTTFSEAAIRELRRSQLPYPESQLSRSSRQMLMQQGAHIFTKLSDYYTELAEIQNRLEEYHLISMYVILQNAKREDARKARAEGRPSSRISEFEADSDVERQLREVRVNIHNSLLMRARLALSLATAFESAKENADGEARLHIGTTISVAQGLPVITRNLPSSFRSNIAEIGAIRTRENVASIERATERLVVAMSDLFSAEVPVYESFGRDEDLAAARATSVLFRDEYLDAAPYVAERIQQLAKSYDLGKLSAKTETMPDEGPLASKLAAALVSVQTRRRGNASRSSTAEMKRGFDSLLENYSRLRRGLDLRLSVPGAALRNGSASEVDAVGEARKPDGERGD